jgi:hypothetical protein
LNPNPNPNTKPQTNPNPYPNIKPQPNPNPNFTNWEVAKEVYVLLNAKSIFLILQNLHVQYPCTSLKKNYVTNIRIIKMSVNVSAVLRIRY